MEAEILEIQELGLRIKFPGQDRAPRSIFPLSGIRLAPENAPDINLRVFYSQNRYPLLRNTRKAPDAFRPSPRSSPIDVVTMMPMVMAPVVVVPRAKAANLARAVIGPDHTAVAVRVVIIGRRIIEVPVKAVVAEREPAVTKAAAAENMRGSIPAAMKYRTTPVGAAMIDGTANMANAMEGHASSAATMVAATAVPAVDFGGHPAGNMFRRRRRSRIDQRHRLRTLAGCGRQHQYRGSREPQATDKAAPGI